MYIPDVETDERVDLREVVRDLVATLSPESKLREVIETDLGHDPDLWRALLDMGLAGLTIPESLGGAEAGVEELAVVFQEMGRALVPAPLFSSTVAATLVEAVGNAQVSSRYLPRIADGTALVAVALFTEGGHWSTEGIASDVMPAGDEWVITGERRLVVDGMAADVLLLPAITDAGIALFAVDLGESGVVKTRLTTLDLTRRVADIAFERVPATLLATGGEAESALASAIRRAILIAVCEQTGVAEKLMSTAVDYATFRYQFGRLIGEFQAIKHKLADMALDLERMKSVQQELVRLTAAGDPEAVLVTHMAKAYCSEALFRIAADTIQTLGGVGYTWDYDAHLYFRRAKSSEMLLGDPEYHREAMLSILERT